MIENNKKQDIRLFQYSRVSTLKQKEDKTIEQQELLIQKHVEKFNSEDHEYRYIIIEKFRDEAKSGYKFDETNRPEFNKMFEKLKSDNIDGVIAYSLDRLGRETENLLKFFREVGELGKKIILVEGKIDRKTPFGRFLSGLNALMSEFDGDTIKYKLNTGRKRKKAKNILEGKPATFGFGRRPKIVPIEIKEKMIRWYEKGYGFKQIQRRMQEITYKEWNEETRSYEDKKGFKLSTATIGVKLRQWKVKIREPKNLKIDDAIQKTIDKEVDKRIKDMKEELLKNIKGSEKFERELAKRES